MELMVERLLEKDEENEWPDFARSDNLYDQLFKRGSEGRKLTRPTGKIEEMWVYDTTATKILRDNAAKRVPTGCYNSIGEQAHITFKTAFLNNLKLNFCRRQREAIRIHLVGAEKRNGATLNRLQNAINNWSPTIEEEHAEFVRDHRRKEERTTRRRL